MKLLFVIICVAVIIFLLAIIVKTLIDRKKNKS